MYVCVCLVLLGIVVNIFQFQCSSLAEMLTVTRPMAFALPTIELVYVEVYYCCFCCCFVFMYNYLSVLMKKFTYSLEKDESLTVALSFNATLKCINVMLLLPYIHQ